MQHLPVFATKTAAMMSSAACGNSCGLMTEIGGCVCSLVFCSLTFSKTCVCSQLFGVYVRRILYRTHRWPTRAPAGLLTISKTALTFLKEKT